MNFKNLSKSGSEFLGVEYPILGGAMSWISDSDLASGVSNAGGFGVVAGGNMPPELLVAEIEETKKKTDKNFAANLITVSPVFQEQLTAVIETGVSYIVFAGGVPSAKDIAKAKDAGVKVIAFAPSLALGKRIVKWGADALIIEGNEAGGHVGPVSTMVLLQEILFNITDVPVFVAGGIATGRMIAHLILMGAAGVQMGTRFVLSEEANVDEKMKKAFKRASGKDAIVSSGIDRRIPVIPVRGLKNEGSESFVKLQLDMVAKMDAGEISTEEAAHKVEEFWLGALRNAVKGGDIEKGSLMAGQSISLMKDIKPIKDIILDMVKEADEEMIVLSEKFK